MLSDLEIGSLIDDGRAVIAGLVEERSRDPGLWLPKGAGLTATETLLGDLKHWVRELEALK